jgi:hypothetical protein
LGRARGARPVGKEEGEKEVGCGVLGQKGGGEGFGEFFFNLFKSFSNFKLKHLFNFSNFKTFQTLFFFKFSNYLKDF